jgi:hypothetical protein
MTYLSGGCAQTFHAEDPGHLHIVVAAGSVPGQPWKGSRGRHKASEADQLKGFLALLLPPPLAVPAPSLVSLSSSWCPDPRVRPFPSFLVPAGIRRKSKWGAGRATCICTEASPGVREEIVKFREVAARSICYALYAARTPPAMEVRRWVAGQAQAPDTTGTSAKQRRPRNAMMAPREPGRSRQVHGRSGVHLPARLRNDGAPGTREIEAGAWEIRGPSASQGRRHPPAPHQSKRRIRESK